MFPFLSLKSAFICGFLCPITMKIHETDTSHWSVALWVTCISVSGPCSLLFGYRIEYLLFPVRWVVFLCLQLRNEPLHTGAITLTGAGTSISSLCPNLTALSPWVDSLRVFSGTQTSLAQLTICCLFWASCFKSYLLVTLVWEYAFQPCIRFALFALKAFWFPAIQLCFVLRKGLCLFVGLFVFICFQGSEFIMVSDCLVC